MPRRLPVFLLVLGVLLGGIWWLESRTTPVQPRLILLITPDTLRRDHVGVFGDAGYTPQIDAWASEAVRFTEARTPAPLTLPAHVTMLTGLPPGGTGIRTNAERVPPAESRPYTLLSERLRDAGWHTAAFVSASVLGAHVGLGPCFDHYDDGGLRDQGGLELPERAGAETVRLALEHLRTQPDDKPIFLWVHLFDPHAPYSATGRYADDVRVVDAAIGTLLAHVDPETTCVLFAADHGEALGDLGEPTHGVLLGDAVLRVPFLLKAPGVAAGTRADTAELADVAPTLAALAGIEWPASSLPGAGRNLLEPAADRLSIAEALEGDRRYRWAQLIGASDARGTLVDAGEGRFHWFPRRVPGEDQAGPQPPVQDEALDALVNFIAKYKKIDTPPAGAGPGAGGPYTHGPNAGPLLDPGDNARRPDPYTAIGRATTLAKLAQTIRSAPAVYRVLGAAINKLRQLQAVDPGNPEIPFWLGMAHEGVADRASRDKQAGRAAEAAAKAAAAYKEAFQKGRRDATTIWKAAGVNGRVDPAGALTLLKQLAAQLPYEDCQVLLLEALLLRDLGRGAEADAVCARAQAICKEAGRERIWTKTCAGR